jgi:hypothetical protein
LPDNEKDPASFATPGAIHQGVGHASMAKKELLNRNRRYSRHSARRAVRLPSSSLGAVSIPLAAVAATLSVLTVVEAAHVPTPATIKAATANELVLRIWGPPANEPRHAAQVMVVEKARL